MTRHANGNLKTSLNLLNAEAAEPDARMSRVPAGAAIESPRLDDHPLRHVLNNELHARPVMALQSPERISHLALPCDEQGAVEDHAILVKLCERYGVVPPRAAVNHFAHDFGLFRLKWERHTEFITYTFFRRGSFDEPFETSALADIATDWLDRLPGQVIAAVHIALLPAPMSSPSAEDLSAYFVSEPAIGSAVAGGAAVAFTDCRIHADGLSRILIHDRSLGCHQAGRLVQRLLEIETYRMMALLALPIAHELRSEIARCERELADATAALAGPEAARDERTRSIGSCAWLRPWSRHRRQPAIGSAPRRPTMLLSRRTSRNCARTACPGFRPSPSSWSGACSRPCGPAPPRSSGSRTSRSASRVPAPSCDPVDIAVQEQNRLVLQSMNRRARLQLVLNEMVEGLSVFAITYYALGVLAYPVKALQPLIRVDPGLAIGAASPLVFILVWLGLRRLRARLLRQNVSETLSPARALEQSARSGLN